MSGRRELALYVVAAVAYIALGVAFPELLLSWFEGVAFLLVAVWLLPAAYSRLRGARSAGGARGAGPEGTV